MSRLPQSFFSVAAVCGLSGMVMGVVMGATGAFALSPAHAHLNLLGWVTLALMGGYYALTGRGGRVGWANFALSAAGAMIMPVSLGFMLSGNQAMLPGVHLGAACTVLGMIIFVSVVGGGWRRPLHGA